MEKEKTNENTGRLIDRAPGQALSREEGREILGTVFRNILPRHGYQIRGEQIGLAECVMDTICRRRIILAEAQVGTGKTHAYLIAAIIAKRGRMNDYWNKAYYPDASYAEMADMPILITTSTMALQKALVRDYIPELSGILMENGIISTPLTVASRKGRSNYVCDHRLRSHIPYEGVHETREVLISLLDPKAAIDLGEVTGLCAHVKKIISVPGRCSDRCPCREICRYRGFVRESEDTTVDIQITNHNFFLADVMGRGEGKRPLLPNYQVAVIDEAHKFLAAARSMYGHELQGGLAEDILRGLDSIHPSAKMPHGAIRNAAKKLADENRRLFYRLISDAVAGLDEDVERHGVEIDPVAARHLRNIRVIAGRLHGQLKAGHMPEHLQGRVNRLLEDIKEIREKADAFIRGGENICWLETDPDGEVALCSIPKELHKYLYRDIWKKGIPTVLTSGTLSADGDFTRTKATLGLDMAGKMVATASKPSPFDHRCNTLIYTSENVPFPDGRNPRYIEALAEEIRRLTEASHGHAAVLFTSYNTLGRVHAALSEMNIPYPLMRLERGSTATITQFKKAGNGILLASGALWEGIDIPGDTLSMLIIVKLPFQAPDAISEYEQSLYPDFNAYLDGVLVPDMLIKLKQGFGRLIRSETDTGVAAILDCRASRNGNYRKRVLDALPDCRMTDSINDISDFFKARKPAGYFE